MRREIVAAATAVLRRSSALDDEKYLVAIRNAFKQGLAGKAFSVRAYAELYSEFTSREMFDEAHRVNFHPMKDSTPFEHPVHPQLAELRTPGPGYTHKKSQQFIKNRYERAIRPIRHSLPRLLSDANFRKQVSKLKAKGYKDWHILLIVMNVATQYRIEQRLGKQAHPDTVTPAMKEEVGREERSTDTPIPPSIFTDERMEIQDEIMWLTMARTWGLRLTGPTPDFRAYKQLLTHRYRALEDDIPHVDLFPGI